MKKHLWAILFIFIALSLSLSAASWSIEAGTGYRASATMKPNQLRFFDLGFSYDGFSLYARNHAFNTFDLTAEYEIRAKKFILNRFIGHTRYILEEGGYSDLSYEFGLIYDSKHFLLSAALGVRGAVSYSEYSDLLLYGVSPLITVKTGLKSEYVALTAFGDMASRYENNWKALALFGVSIEIFIDEHSSLLIDAYSEASEYLMDPYYMPYASALRLAYKYRGI